MQFRLNQSWLANQIANENSLIDTGEAKIRFNEFKDLQTALSLLATHYKTLGLLLYADNRNHIEILHKFIRASEYYLKVLELREKGEVPKKLKDGSTVLPWDTDVSINPELFENDFSLTNSGYTLDFFSIAAITGNLELRNEIISLAWDPSNASYIGDDSEVCTWNEHFLAYAIREFINKQEENSNRFLSKIKPANDDVHYLKGMLEALMKEDVEKFTASMIGLGDYHGNEVFGDDKNINLFLCLRGLGLYAVAKTERLGQSEKISIDSEYLPLHLVRQNMR